MAWYPTALRKNIPPGPNDPPITPRVVILHVAASEGPSLYPYFNGPSGGVESHFYIRYDGTTEQYRDTDIQADANTDANGFAISIETEGLEYGVWTDAQLAAIKALILWCHDVHGIPLVVCPAWDGAGVGYHTLFPGSWDKRGASCPGPNRKTQFATVLVPWLANPHQEDDMTPEQSAKFEEMWQRTYNAEKSAGEAARYGQSASVRTQRIEAALKALATSLPAATAKAVTDALDADYDATVTLTPKETA